MSQGRNRQDLLVAAPRRVVGGFVVAIAMLVIVTAVTLFGLSQRERNITTVERSFSMLRTIDDLASDVSSSRLALAEFLVLGDRQLLEPYERARRNIPENLGKLGGLVAHRPVALHQLEQLRPVIDAALDREARDIAARRDGASLQDLRPLLTDGKTMLDRAAALLEDLKEDTANQLNEEQRDLSEDIQSAAVVVVAGDSVLLALIVAAAVLSIRDAAEKARAVQFQRRVLGMVGHDLRNPLSVVSMSASQIAKHGSASDGKAWAARIVAAANRMDRLIRDLLDGSRIELGIALPLDIRSGSANESCDRVVEDFRTTHPQRAIEYRPGESGDVEWDPDRIEQVLENLLGNALKYSPERTPVRLSWRRTVNAIILDVENGGPPIPSSLLPHLFEPFRRGLSSRDVGSKGGVGLGLYIVQHIVRQHGGTIDVGSSHEAGTKFSVVLPQSRPPSAPRASNAQQVATTAN
jgi:signal transduction histidine kinase